MSYSTQQPSAWASLGSGLGKGLSEQIPKEMDRYRLSQGLDKFAKNNPESPLIQQYADLLKIPGVKDSPQLLQTFGDLARTGALSAELSRGGQVKPEHYLPSEKSKEGQPGEPPVSLTEPRGTEETRRPYIPPGPEERKKMAFSQYPKLAARDPNQAMAQVDKDIEQELQRSEAIQATRPKQADIQKTVQDQLENDRKKLGIPQDGVAGNFYKKTEDQALRSVLPISDGGKGYTEQQAASEYSKKLQNWNKDYNQIKSWGSGFLMGPHNRSKVQRQIESMRKGFKERNDLENYADLLVSENGLSNEMAYYKAFKPSEYKVYNDLKKIPEVPIHKRSNISEKTEKIIPSIASQMGKDSASPLAVAKYLELKGYDADMFINYLDINREELDLDERQIRELSKSRSEITNLSDLWFTILGGKKQLLGD